MGFGRLLPFGQWVFDKSRGQLNTPVILHSICCVALCEPAATELESKNTHGVSDLLRSLFTDLFFDFVFDFYSDFDCTLQDNGDLRRILQVRGHLLL